MPALPITTSPNIASLDSLIVADLCGGYFYVDLTPTVYIGSGETLVLGAKVQITNPYNVVVRGFPTPYDMTPDSVPDAMNTVVQFAIPTQANNYQYGVYKIEVQLTDEDGTIYTLAKNVSICQPNPLDKTKKYGSLGAKLSGICSAGKVFVLVDAEPSYKGIVAGAFNRALVLDYPTGSGVTSANTSQSSFSVQLYEGVYKISGTSCTSYEYGDNITVKVQYKVDFSKPILCSLDECCVFTSLEALNEKLNSDCSDQEKTDTKDKIERATLLLHTIDYGARCGEDISDYIVALEDVIGMPCACNFNSPTPVVNNNPSTDVIINGCNITSEVVGLTTIYTLENYSYEVTVTPNGGVLTIGAATLSGCIKTQVLTFDVNKVYTQIQGLANATLAQSQFWAGVIKKSLNSVDASCLGYDSTQWTALTLDGAIQAMIDKSCLGADCAATINTIAATQQGGNVNLSWTETGAYTVDVFVDGVLLATVLSTTLSYLLNGYADGATHTYLILPKCANGVSGDPQMSTFGFTGCPTIAVPTVSTTSVTSAICPYDLTGLVSPLPPGIEAEWHTANNTLSTSVVPDETSVSDGTYYVFATDTTGCYSTSKKVVITCAVTSSCTAPQSLAVTPIIGGLKVSFSSAAYPPPANSYTVSRKAASDPDITGSYSLVGSGTPTYNASTGKWEITDSTAVANTLYTYKAQSNCSASVPYITLDTAKITCPTLTLTSTTNTIGYSFAPVGGEVDKYVVEIFTNSGITAFDSDTFLPSFSNPITGTFAYLTAGDTYKVRVTMYIGTYSSACSFNTKMTVGYNYTLVPRYNFSIDSVSGTGVPSLAPTGVYSAEYGTHTAMSGSYSIVVSGTIVVAIHLSAYVNGLSVGTVPVPSAGTYSLSITALDTDNVVISIDPT